MPTLEGAVERITFHNEENGYTVARLIPDGKDYEVTVIGNMLGVQVGEHVRLEGEWSVHGQYGRQFKVERYASVLPATAAGIEKYLGSGLVKGVGPVTATRIVRKFGADTLTVIDETPERLREVLGVGPKRVGQIKSAWHEQRQIREVMVFLQSHGVSPALAVRIYKHYGDGAAGVVRNDPYRLARDIHGIGFITADKIARNLGIASDAPERVAAGVAYTLSKKADEGHVYVPQGELVQASAKLLEVAEPLAAAAIDSLRQDEQVRVEPLAGGTGLAEERAVYLTPFYYGEIGVAGRLRRLMDAVEDRCFVFRSFDWPQGLAVVQRDTGLRLTAQQQAAVRTALTERVTVLTGGPGTGKAQPVHAKVLTPTGWATMADVKVGDTLLAPDGSTTKVLGVFPQGVRPVWEVEFEDGRVVECCEDHLWRVWTRTSVWSPTKKKKVRQRGWRTVTTKEIAQWYARNRSEVQRTAVPVVHDAMPYQEQNLDIPPYVMGIILAEGHLGSGITVSTSDEDMVQRIQTLLPGNMHILPATAKYTYRISLYAGYKGQRQANPFLNELRRCGLLGKRSYEKFIPDRYKRAGLQQRYDLLQGVLDGDGHVDCHGAMSFTSTSAQLAKDVQELVWSLGGIATISSRQTTYTYKGEKRQGRVSFTVRIRHGNGRRLFGLARKQQRINPDSQVAWDRVKIVSIQATERSAPMMCIAVDHPAQLYVTDNYIVTHNTTTMRSMIRLLDAARRSYVLASPTGRAAKRLGEATGKEAKTIHRLLEWSPGGAGGFTFQRNEDNPLDVDMVIVDEASMLDLLLTNHLLKAIPPGAHLLLVGDIDQLPPVGAGNVLRDVIDSGAAAVVRLDVIFRQAAGSFIIENAHRINRGQMPEWRPEQSQDFFLFQTDDPERAAELVSEIVQERIPRKFGIAASDVQVLSPMHRGAAGVGALNERLQAALNPPAAAKPERRIGGRIFRLGDRVMQMRNNYDKDVFNGDLGQIVALDPVEQSLTVRIDGHAVPYDFLELDELVHAYAISVHKSQGSEFPAVVVPITTQHYMMLQRNLLYTAVTRARKLVVLVGSPRAVAIAVNNNKIADRYSALAERLR